MVSELCMSLSNRAYQLVFYIFSGKMEKFLNIMSTNKCLNEDNNEEENKRKLRKCDDIYLDIGFTYIKMDIEERPRCVICLKVL